jgi:hypothetical protein
MKETAFGNLPQAGQNAGEAGKNPGERVIGRTRFPFHWE